MFCEYSGYFDMGMTGRPTGGRINLPRYLSLFSCVTFLWISSLHTDIASLVCLYSSADMSNIGTCPLPFSPSTFITFYFFLSRTFSFIFSPSYPLSVISDSLFPPRSKFVFISSCLYSLSNSLVLIYNIISHSLSLLSCFLFFLFLSTFLHLTYSLFFLLFSFSLFVGRKWMHCKKSFFNVVKTKINGVHFNKHYNKIPLVNIG